ncbi:4-diphosphocytidyl-2-C-methyl-D-erythritol kinase [Spirochaetia bacterium]|nr:4-diphosphocytidyl-2-C-methyl-D-erythritol kinase [Spirochaetia bacterium]
MTLAFGDTLTFETLDSQDACEIHIEGNTGLAKSPIEENLVFKAVSLFREYTGCRLGFKIVIEKRIPLGSGFGGASTDAASALRALDLLAGTSLSRKDLLEMAEKLGSDVPFFLSGGTAFVTGRGERLRRLETPRGRRELSVVLVHPGFPSDTAGAYRLFDRIEEMGGSLSWAPKLSYRELSARLALDPREWLFGNDFLTTFLAAGEAFAASAAASAAKAYGKILEDLDHLGADFGGLSGSGSGCFGIFVDEDLAKKAVKKISGKWPFVHLTFPLARFGNTVVQ